jgi:hypothetical protein
LKRRPVPKKKKISRLPEPDPKSRTRGLLDKRTKKYGVVQIILDDELGEELEEIEEEPESESGS